MSAKGYWAGFEDDDVVPIPGQPCRVGDILGDYKLEVRALVWSFLEVKAKVAIREAYQRAMAVPDMTEVERIGILTKAAVRVGLEVLEKYQDIEDQRRHLAALARSAKTSEVLENRWGSAVRERLRKSPRMSAEHLATALRADKRIKHPPAASEQSTFGRYVRKVKDEMKVRHSLSE
jgi:hypothetical protein